MPSACATTSLKLVGAVGGVHGLTVGVGDGDGVGVGVALGVGVGVGVALGVGVGVGVALTTPLFHTNFLPDLTHV